MPGFDVAAYYLLLLLVVLTPWLNAGADLTLRSFLYGTAALQILCVYLHQVRGKRSLVLPHVTWLLLLGLIFVAGQLLPAEWIHTTSAELRESLSGSTAGTLTLNPSETRVHLSLAVVCVGIFLSGAELFSDIRRFRLLCLALIVNGAAITVFGIIQRFTWNDHLYWVFALPKNHTTFGPMVYHNVAGAYLCMAFSTVFALMLLRGQSLTLESSKVALYLLLGCVVVGLFSTLSRGALLSAAFAGLVVGGLLLRRIAPSKRALMTFVPIAGCACGLLFWFGMTEEVTQRLSEISGEEMVNNGRWEHWLHALRAAPDFWGIGCGLGAYGDTVATFKSSSVFFTHAHNQYVETLVTTGIVGCVLLAGLIVLLMRQYSQAIATAPTSRLGIVATLSFAFLSQLAHSLVDYCLFIPGVAITFAAIIGSSFARSSMGGSKVVSGLSFHVIWLALIGGATWATYDASSAARVDYASRQVPDQQELALLSAADVTQHIDELKSAMAWREDEPRVQEVLANLYSTRYRLLALNKLSLETGVSAEVPNLWLWTALPVLHGRAHGLLSEGKIDLLEGLKQDPVIAGSLAPCMDALLKSRAACPLLPSVHLRLEELGFLRDELDGRHAARARATAADNPQLLYQCGRLEFGAGRFERASACWRASLSASTQFLAEIRRLGIAKWDSEVFVDKVIPDQLEVLVGLLEDKAEDSLDGTHVLTRAKELISQSALDSPEEMYIASRVAQLGGETAAAIEYLKRAVSMAPENVRRRFELAKALAAAGQMDDAEREAKLCLRIKRSRAVQDFLKDLRSDPSR